MPPVTVNAPLLNATPTSPVVTAAQVTEGVVLMVIAQAALVAPLASVTFTVNVPEVVGVPVTAPVEVFSVKPTGSVPTIENV